MTRAPAFTLVETLAVVTLLALAAVLLTPLVAGGTRASAVDATLRGFLDLDARARLAAQGGSGARLHRSGESWVLMLSESGIASWQGRAAVEIEVHDSTGASIGEIAYSAAGRSSDFVVTARLYGVVRSARVAGLTGWTEVGP